MSKLLLLVFVVTSIVSFSKNPSVESLDLKCLVHVGCKRFYVDKPLCGKGVYTENGNTVLKLVGLDCNGERIHRYNTIWYMIAKSSHIALHQCRDRLKCKIPETYLHPTGDRRFVVVVTEKNIAKHLEINLKYIKESKIRMHDSTHSVKKQFDEHQKKDDKDDTEINGNKSHEEKQENQHKKDNDKEYDHKGKGQNDRKNENVNDFKNGRVIKKETDKNNIEKDYNKDSKERENDGYVNHIILRDNPPQTDDMVHTESKLGVVVDTKKRVSKQEKTKENLNIKDEIRVPEESNVFVSEKGENLFIKKREKTHTKGDNKFELRVNSRIKDETVHHVNITEIYNKNYNDMVHARIDTQNGNRKSKNSKKRIETGKNDYLIDVVPIYESKSPVDSTNMQTNDKQYKLADTLENILRSSNNSSSDSTSITRYNEKQINNIGSKRSKKITQNLIQNLDTLLSDLNAPKQERLNFKESTEDKNFNLIPRPPVLLDKYEPKPEQLSRQNIRLNRPSKHVPKYQSKHVPKYQSKHISKYQSKPSQYLQKYRSKHRTKSKKMFKKNKQNYLNDNQQYSDNLSSSKRFDVLGNSDGKETNVLKSPAKKHDTQGNGILSKNDTKINVPVSTLEFRKEIVNIPSYDKKKHSRIPLSTKKPYYNLNIYVESKPVSLEQSTVKDEHINNHSSLNAKSMGIVYHGTLNRNRTSWQGNYVSVPKNQLHKLIEVFLREKQHDALKSKLRYKLMRNYVSNTQKELKEKKQQLKQRKMSNTKKVNDMKKELKIQNIQKDKKLRDKVKDLSAKAKVLKDKEFHVQKLKKKYDDFKEREKLQPEKIKTQIGISSLKHKVLIPVEHATDSTIDNGMKNVLEVIKEVQLKKKTDNVQSQSVRKKNIETEAVGSKSDVHNANELINEDLKKASGNNIHDENIGNRLNPNTLYPQNHDNIRNYVFSQPEIRIPLKSHHLKQTNPEELKHEENLYFLNQIHKDASKLKDRLNCNRIPNINAKIESELSSIEGNIYRILAEKTNFENSKKLQKKVHNATFATIADSLNKSCSRQLNDDMRIGKLTNWGPWGNCSVNCGEGGFQLRNRTCTTNKCVGSLWDVKECSKHTPCQANWMKWSTWGPCSSSCDKGYTTRTRVCISQVQKAKCSGNFIKVQPCNTHRCKLNNWTEWSSWSGCSVSCGTGFQERIRDCKLQAESKDTLPPCEGGSYEHRLCVHSSCSGGNGAILDSISKFQSAAMICDRATRERSNYVVWKTPDTTLITSKTQTDRIKISGPYLIIHNLKESDRGLYKCALLSKLPYTKTTNDCRSHLCLNGGQCIEQSHIGISKPLFVCICKSGYGGVYCTEDSGSSNAHIIGIVFLVIILAIAKCVVFYLCCKFRKSVDYTKFKDKTNADGTKKSSAQRLKSIFGKKHEDKVGEKMTQDKSTSPKILSETILPTETHPSVKKGKTSSTNHKTVLGARSSLKNDINNLLGGATEALKKKTTKDVKSNNGSFDNIIQGIKKYIPGNSKEAISRCNSITGDEFIAGSVSISISDFSSDMKSISVDAIHNENVTGNVENRSEVSSNQAPRNTIVYPESTLATNDVKADIYSKKSSQEITNFLLDRARVILPGTNISSTMEGSGIKSDKPNTQSMDEALGQNPPSICTSKENTNASYRPNESTGNTDKSLERIEMSSTGDYVFKSLQFNTSPPYTSLETKKVYQVTPHPKLLQNKFSASNAKERIQTEITKKCVTDCDHKSDTTRMKSTQVKTIESSEAEAVNEEGRPTDLIISDGIKSETASSVSENPKKRESRLEIVCDEFKKIDDTIYCNTHKTSVIIGTSNSARQKKLSCEHGFISLVNEHELFSICCREHHLRMLDIFEGYTAGYSEGHQVKNRDLVNLKHSIIRHTANDKMSEPNKQNLRYIKGSSPSRDDVLLKSMTITPFISGGSVESGKSYERYYRSIPIHSDMSPKGTDNTQRYSASLTPSLQSNSSFISTPINSDSSVKSITVTPSLSGGSVESGKSYESSYRFKPIHSDMSPQGTDNTERYSASLTPSLQSNSSFISSPINGDSSVKSITVTPSISGGSVESKKSYESSYRSKPIHSDKSPKGTDNTERYSASLTPSLQSDSSFISTPINGDSSVKSITVTPSISGGSVESRESQQSSFGCKISLLGKSAQPTNGAEFYSSSLSPINSYETYSTPSTPYWSGVAKNSKTDTDSVVNYQSNERMDRSNNWDISELEAGEQIDKEMDEDFKNLKTTDPELLSQFQTVSTPKKADLISLISREPSSNKQEIDDMSNVSLQSMSDLDESQYFNPIENMTSRNSQNTIKHTESLYVSSLPDVNKDPSSVKNEAEVSLKRADRISFITQEPSFKKEEMNDISNVSLKSMPDLDESQYFNPIENMTSRDSQNTTKSGNGSVYMSPFPEVDKCLSSVKDESRRNTGEESVDLSDLNYTFSPETTEIASSITNSGVCKKIPGSATMIQHPIKHDDPETTSSLSKPSNSSTLIISSSGSLLKSYSQGFVVKSTDPILNPVRQNVDTSTVEGKDDTFSRLEQLTSYSNETFCDKVKENLQACNADNNSVDISFSTFITKHLNAPNYISPPHSDNKSSGDMFGSVTRLSTFFMSPDTTPVSPQNLKKSKYGTGVQNPLPLKIEKSSHIHPEASNEMFPDRKSSDPVHESVLVKSVSVTEICQQYSQYTKPNTGDSDSTTNTGISHDKMYPERQLSKTSHYQLTEPPLQNNEKNSMSHSTSFYSVDNTTMSVPFATNEAEDNAEYLPVRIPNSYVAEGSLEKSCDVTDDDDVYCETFNMNKFKRIMCPIPEEEDSLGQSVDFKSPYSSTTDFDSVKNSESNTVRTPSSDFKSPCPSDQGKG